MAGRDREAVIQNRCPTDLAPPTSEGATGARGEEGPGNRDEIAKTCSEEAQWARSTTKTILKRHLRLTQLLPAKYPSQVVTAGGKVQACSRRPGDGVSIFEIWTDLFGKW